MTSFTRRSRRLLAFVFVYAASLLASSAVSLYAEGYPFRAWDEPAPQGIECRLLHWTPDAAILETTTRQYVAVDWRKFSSEDREYFNGVRVEKQFSPVDPELLQDPIPLFYPSGIFLAPLHPIAFNGRYVTTAGTKMNRPQGEIYAYRDFAPQTQGQLLERFADKLSVGETIFAGGPFRESIWIVDERRSIQEIAPDIEVPAIPYPEDTFVVATDGSIVVYETRLGGTAKDSDKYPCYFFSPWVDAGPKSQEPLLRFIHLGFATHAKESPAATSRIVQAAHAKANRGKVGPLADARVWKQAMLSAEAGAQEGRLIQRNARQAVILREDGCLDIVDFPTAADAKYLNGLEGFWSPRHDSSRPVRYEEKKAPAFSRDLAALFRDYDGDKTLIDDLEAGLVPTPETAVEDHCWFREMRLSRLADVVLQCDLGFGEHEYARLKVAFDERKITQAEAGRRLIELRARRIDPTDGDTPAEKLIADWKKAYPQSPNPAIVAGMAAYRYAWQRRGDGFGNELDDSEVEGFGLYLDKAEGELEEADDRADKDAVVALWRLQIGRCLAYPRDRMEEILEQGVAADSNYPALHVAMVLYLLPMWHGEPGDISEYMNSATRRYRGQRAINNFVQAYEQLLTTSVETLKNGTFDKETLSMVGADMVELSSPGTEVWLYAEMLAFFADDKALAKALIEKTGGIEKLAVMTAAGNGLFKDGDDQDKAKAFYWEALKWSGPTHGDAGMADFKKSFRLGVAAKVEPSLVLMEGGKSAMTIVADDEAIVVDLEKGEVVRKLSLPKLKYSRLRASRDGATILLAGQNSDESLYVARIDPTGVSEPVLMKDLPKDAKSVREILSPDGMRFVCTIPVLNAGTILCIWDARTGAKLDEQRFPFGKELMHPLFDNAGTRLTFWKSEEFAIYDESTKKVSRFPLKNRSIAAGYHLPSGELLLIGWNQDAGPNLPPEEQDKAMIVASAEEAPTAEFVRWPLGYNSTNVGLLFSKDRKRFFKRYGNQGEPPSIDVYDLATSEKTHRLYGSGVAAWAYRDSDETLVTVSSEGTVTLWDVSERNLAALAKRKGEVPKAP